MATLPLCSLSCPSSHRCFPGILSLMPFFFCFRKSHIHLIKTVSIPSFAQTGAISPVTNTPEYGFAILKELTRPYGLSVFAQEVCQEMRDRSERMSCCLVVPFLILFLLFFLGLTSVKDSSTSFLGNFFFP